MQSAGLKLTDSVYLQQILMIVILQPKSLIIDGKTVAAIMKQGDLRWKLAFIAACCETVIACRLSPLQKSQMVSPFVILV